ncbi:hypothetical protein BRD56_08255 [Thermoplasmatales archaeon SW_10_69_26]|nr:MAG: hypothetical protein BRD56_08255 [Thermoplasmatales archaeon SW_10_69_26]
MRSRTRTIAAGLTGLGSLLALPATLVLAGLEPSWLDHEPFPVAVAIGVTMMGTGAGILRWMAGAKVWACTLSIPVIAAIAAGVIGVTAEGLAALPAFFLSHLAIFLGVPMAGWALAPEFDDASSPVPSISRLLINSAIAFPLAAAISTVTIGEGAPRSPEALIFEWGQRGVMVGQLVAIGLASALVVLEIREDETPADG